MYDESFALALVKHKQFCVINIKEAKVRVLFIVSMLFRTLIGSFQSDALHLGVLR